MDTNFSVIYLFLTFLVVSDKESLTGFLFVSLHYGKGFAKNSGKEDRKAKVYYVLIYFLFRYVFLKDMADISISYFLRMSQRHLLYVTDVSKTSFVRYGCLKDVFCTLCMSQRCLL